MNMVFDKIGEGGVLQKIPFSACARGPKNSFVDLLAGNSSMLPLLMGRL
jgi:hypothetical protein